MAVVIRMKRTGRRNRPCYRISVADSRFPRDGRTLDTLGLYDPVSSNTEAQATLNVERARHWIQNGARPSETVHSLFKRMGVYEGEFAPKERKRERPGRKKVTAARTRRRAEKGARAERKEARRNERQSARRAAAKAAASEAQEGAGDA